MADHDDGMIPGDAKPLRDRFGNSPVFLAAVYSVRLGHYVPVIIYAETAPGGHFQEGEGAVTVHRRFPAEEDVTVPIFHYDPDGVHDYEAVGPLGLQRRGLVDPWGGPHGED